MLWKRKKRSPEQEEKLDERLMELLGTIYENDGRGGAHPILLAGFLQDEEKAIETGAKRLAARGLVTIDSLGDVYITESGINWYEKRKAGEQAT